MDTKEDVSSSIPHMHLFMYLKRKFPTLKDADITDVIQRFGLDKVRCEIELTRKNEEDHRGYHSPWNRSRTSSSRGSTSSRNSPLSPSDTHSYSTSSPPLQNGNSPSPPLSNASQSSVNNCFKIDDDDDHFNQRSNIPTSDDQLSNRTLNFSPYSSPIKTNTNTTDIGQWGHSSQRVTDSGFDVSVTDYEELENKGKGLSLTEEDEPLLFDKVIPNKQSCSPCLVDKRSQQTPNSRNLNENTRPLYLISTDSNMNSADPVSSPPKSEANISSSAPSNNENSQRDHQLSQQSQQTQQSQQQPIPAAIQEQILRKTRLEEELSLRIGEKRKLETEVKNLGEELQIRETNQRLEVARNKKEIEVIQQENSKLQSACDEMEREILESGESPKTDEEGRGAQRLRFPSSPNNYSGTVTPVQDNSLRSFSQQVLPRANSTSSLSSGRVVSPLSPLAPSRKAPSPPVISPISSAPDPASRNVEQVAQRPATIGSDENRREWACRKCTFINSRYLNECEICGFHHVSVGTPTQNLPPQTQAPSPGGPCYCHHRRHYSQGQDHRNAGELQDIHIQVRHHNLP